jgi:beta-lactamase regulating signal transducer with metallopeptidase domain
MTLLSFLATYLLHSTLLLGGAWLAARALRSRPEWEEAAWKIAAVGGLLTATFQVGLGLEPWAGRVPLGVAPEASLAVAVGAPSAGPPASEPWVATAVGGWAAVASLLLAALLYAWWRLHRRLSGRREIASGPLPELLAKLRRTTGTTRPVRLTSSDALGTPVALGVWKPEICLPSRTAGLTPACQESLLAHELGHLVRRDPAWRWLLCALERIFFFQPLHRLARRRLEHCAELLCDDWAAAHPEPIALARCLTEVAGWPATVRAWPMPQAARSGLRERVERLLSVTPGRTPRRKRGVWIALSGLLVLCACAAPAVSGAKQPTPAATAKRDRAGLGEEIGKIVERALAVVDQVPEIVEKALRHLPTEEIIRGTVNRALKAMPSKESLAKTIREALKDIPSAEELSKTIRKELKKELKKAPPGKP